jgi:hypothetical protein
MFNPKIITLLAALAALAMPVAAVAQQPASADAPSYSRPSYGSDEETVSGRIASFDGTYTLRLNDDRGFVDTIKLHDGTVINPTGLRLVPGMRVTIHGINRGSALAANEIDTPYASYGAVPVYPYAYPYPYPVYAYPGYYYPYNPRLSVGIRIGPSYGYHWH